MADRAYKGKSYPEQYIGVVCKNNYEHVETNKKMINGMEADIVIFDINTIIEYSGTYWHQDKDRDKRKREFIENNGIRLITIWEERISSYSNEHIVIVNNNEIRFFRARKYSDGLYKLIDELGKLLNKQLVIPDNIDEKVRNKVYTEYNNQCLAVEHPNIASELLECDPYKIFSSDTIKRTFKCSKCGLQWKTTIQHRVYNRSGCPYCAGNLAIPGKNDILTLYPEICSEALVDKTLLNTKTSYSNSIITWKCSKCNNVWKTSILNRIVYKTSCPRCRYNIFTDKHNKGWLNIDDLIEIKKPVRAVKINNDTYEVKNTTQCISMLIQYVLSNINKNISDINSVKTSSLGMKQPNIILEHNGIVYYAEGRYGIYYKLNIIKEICTRYSINAIFKIKGNEDLPRNISLNRNKSRYNVAIRFKGKVRFIGSRETLNDAILLKLSAEKFLFGEIKSLRDTYEGTIPEFESLKEVNKFRCGGIYYKDFSKLSIRRL